MNDLTTNITALDLSTIPLMDGANLDVLAIENQLGELPHLDGDRRYEARTTDREFRDEMQAKSAAEAIGRLPRPTEAFHLAIAGKFALWDCVPAILSLAEPHVITSLAIATLGFSKNNVTSMAELLDAGRVGSITLIASHYFKGTSPDIYSHGLEELTKRGQRFLSIRSHAKLLAIKLSDGRTVTIEASANLRSCKNIEQVSVFGDPGLFAFHTGWMEGMFQ